VRVRDSHASTSRITARDDPHALKVSHCQYSGTATNFIPTTQYGMWNMYINTHDEIRVITGQGAQRMADNTTAITISTLARFD
jgi:hypothetical protein